MAKCIRSVDDWHQVAKEFGEPSAREWLAKMYEGGMSARGIGVKLGLTRSGAHHLLKRFGITMRPRGGANRR